MLVGLFCSDNRTKIVTVLLSSEIHAKCVPAAFSRSSCFFICPFASHAAARRVKTYEFSRDIFYLCADTFLELGDCSTREKIRFLKPVFFIDPTSSVWACFIARNGIADVKFFKFRNFAYLPNATYLLYIKFNIH